MAKKFISLDEIYQMPMPRDSRIMLQYIEQVFPELDHNTQAQLLNNHAALAAHTGARSVIKFMKDWQAGNFMTDDQVIDSDIQDEERGE